MKDAFDSHIFRLLDTTSTLSIEYDMKDDVWFYERRLFLYISLYISLYIKFINGVNTRRLHFSIFPYVHFIILFFKND